MSVFVAELHKLVSLRAVRWCALAAVGLTAALTWLNGRAVRDAYASGDSTSVAGAEWIGTGELLIVVAMLAAIGVMSASQEHRGMPADQGGGRQTETSALAVPSRSRSMAAKLAVLVLLGSAVAMSAAAVALLVGQAALGDFALPLGAERWAESARGALYAVLTAVLGAVLTMLLRSGLVPMIYLVANSLVISVGFLLTQLTPLAWYLPDTAGMALLRPPDDVHQPSPLVGGVVMLAWIVAFGVAAWWLSKMRDI